MATLARNTLGRQASTVFRAVSARTPDASARPPSASLRSALPGLGGLARPMVGRTPGLGVRAMATRSDHYYNLLGVTRTADEKDIKGAYRKLAMKHHPDVNQGNEESATAQMTEIIQAYEVPFLSNVCPDTINQSSHTSTPCAGLPTPACHAPHASPRRVSPQRDPLIEMIVGGDQAESSL